MTISIRLTLDSGDWDPNPGGWASELFRIPGVQVKRVYAGAHEISDDLKLDADLGVLRQIRGSKKESITVSIELPPMATKAEVDATQLQLEQARKDAIEEKRRDRTMTGIASLLAFLGVLSTAYFAYQGTTRVAEITADAKHKADALKQISDETEKMSATLSCGQKETDPAVRAKVCRLDCEEKARVLRAMGTLTP